MIRREKKGDAVRVTFALPKEEPVGRVSVVGNFNDWTPCAHPLVRRANGTRSVAVSVPPGALLEFRYLGEGGRWFDEPEADGYLEPNSVVCA